MEFLQKSRSSHGVTWMQEEDYLPNFGRLADALRPLRSIIEWPSNWPHKTGRALSVIVEGFDRITREWGWDRLAEAEPTRSAHAKERRDRFEREVMYPIYEAALSARPGYHGLACPGDVDRDADTGTRLGLRPTMNPEEGRERYLTVQQEGWQARRFGDCYPKVEEETYLALCKAFNLIDAALAEIEAMERGLKAEPLEVSVPSESTAFGKTQPDFEGKMIAPKIAENAWEDLVTLDQAAAMVHKSKRTLERYKTRGKLPAPTVEGGGGKADLFAWKTIRPWLTETFNIQLPDEYPGKEIR